MEEKPAVNTTDPAADQKTVPTPVLTPEEDKEARIATLEEEKARLIEESANYKLGMLKAKGKAKDEDFEEGEDDRMRRIAQETLSNSRLAEIAREQDELIKIALKENKELKLAQKNKTSVPGAMGTHSESTPVTDTLVTNDQILAFKARGWTDKDIERYKTNLRKNTR